MNLSKCLFLLISVILSFPIFSQSDQDVPLKDVVHNDDVIIIGSACAGFDCMNGEAFGSDTQRYKENNLRIHFDDTSNTASFPNNDWRIRINDQTNGGGNYFAIEDATAGQTPFLVEAGAGNNALYVDDQGDVGIGTSTPALDLTILSGNTPSIRLDQDGSSGFAPQIWDVAGNETNFFIRDATNGSTLPFRIRPGAPSSSIFIDTDGDVGIGDASPDATLDVQSGDVLITGAGNTDATHALKVENSDLNIGLFVRDDGKVGIGTDMPEVELHVAGDIGKTGSIVGISDRRVKSNIRPIIDAMSILLLLEGKSFEYQTEKFEGLKLPRGTQYGLIAQDVEKVLPQIVRENFLKWNENEKKLSLKGVYYEQLIPVLINALKEQNGELEELRSENKAILKRLELLERQISGEE